MSTWLRGVPAVALLLAVSIVPGMPAGAAGPTACTVQGVQAIAPPHTTITAAQRRSGPDHCLVDGHVTVDDPGPWNIKFRLALPAAFKNRHFFYAQGGSGGGSVPWPQENSPVPLEYDFADLLGQGFAVVAMDKGTAPSHPLDFAWQRDPVQKLNWDNRALQVIAEASQRLTRGYFGVTSLYRYVSGCSGGGMGSFNNLRVHDGRNFDGVIIGSTVVASPTSAITWMRTLQHILRNPAGWIPPDRLQAAETAILDAYDGVDGADDRIIRDPRRIDLDESLLTRAGLTPAQIETFNVARSSWTYRGLAEPIQVPGYDISRVSAWSDWFVGRVPPPWSVERPQEVPYGFWVASSAFADTDLRTVDLADPAFHKQVQDDTADGAQEGAYDFRGFRDAGGKLLTYYGVDDPAIPFQWNPTIRKGAASYENSSAGLDRWFRSFLVPGLLHCFNGAGPQDAPVRVLDAMVDWVEKGKAPTSIVAHRDNGMSFLLCPEPRTAVLKGGDRDAGNAANWHCKKR